MDELIKDRRVLLAIGGVLALLLGLGVAIGITARGDKPKAPPPASQGGLVVETTGQMDDGKLDPARPLRCFVAGQFVGEMTLADCAKKNGVATGALDVGVDENGQLAAADQAGTTLTPLPPTATAPEAAPVVNQPAPPPVQNPAEPAAINRGPTAACWKYAGGEWKQIAGNVPMGACVQTLYNGTCQRPGGAAYGRWGEQTLRLVPGKVEVSGDNRSFRTLVEQGAGCSVPAG